jgi:hypothetical protein
MIRQLVRRRWRDLPPAAQSVLRGLGVFAFYALITLIVTWPVGARLATDLAGFPDGDQPEYAWSVWYSARTLLHGRNPAHLTTLVYPDGYFYPIRWATLTLYVTALPLALLFSPVVAYNLVFYLSFALTGLTTYLFCCDLTHSRPASLLGGLVFMLFPARAGHAIAGHLDVMSTYWIPAYALLLRRAMLRPTLRNGALAGLVLALAATTSLPHVPYVLAPLTVFLVLHRLLGREGGPMGWPTWRALAVTGGLAGVLLVPFYVPLVIFTLRDAGQLSEGGTVAFSSDLLSFVSPSPDNPVLAGLGLVPTYARKTLAFHIQEVIAYLGVIPVALAGLALFRRQPGARGWALIGLAAMILSLGPLLKVDGDLISYRLENRTSYVVMPYALLTGLPLYSVGRTPGRLNFITGLALSVLAAQGASVWLAGGRAANRRALALAGAGLVLGVEYLIAWPYPTHPAAIPHQAAEILASQAPDGALLDVPVFERQTRQHALLYQTAHGWPLVDGYLHRSLPQEPGLLGTYNWITSAPPDDDIIPKADPALAHALLAEGGVRYVLFQARFSPNAEEVEADLSDWLGEPLTHDPEAILYRVEESEPPQGMAYALEGQDWGVIEEWDGRPGRWLRQRGDMIVYTPEAKSGRLAFWALPLDEVRHLEVTFNGQPLARLVIGQQALYQTPSLRLEPGFNVFTFQVVEPCRQVHGDAHCLVNQALTGLPVLEDECWLADPARRCLGLLFQEVRFVEAGSAETYQALDVELGGQIRLLGYRLPPEAPTPGAAYPVGLAWQALSAPPEDYIQFVHLLNADGDLVAQHDGPPLGGAYNTSAWQPGEIVQEQVKLNLPLGLPPGKYTLAAGMYRYPSLERLSVDEGRYAQDNLVWLGEVEITNSSP